MLLKGTFAHLSLTDISEMKGECTGMNEGGGHMYKVGELDQLVQAGDVEE